MWCWRRILEIPWTAFRINASILKELHLVNSQRLSNICLQRIFTYLGHIARRNSNDLEKLMMKSKVEGKRLRGWSNLPIPRDFNDEMDGSKETIRYTWAAEKSRSSPLRGQPKWDRDVMCSSSTPRFVLLPEGGNEDN